MKLIKAKRLRELQKYRQSLKTAEDEDYFLTLEEQVDEEIFKITQVIYAVAMNNLRSCSYGVGYNKSATVGIKTNMIKSRLMDKGYDVSYDAHANTIDISW